MEAVHTCFALFQAIMEGVGRERQHRPITPASQQVLSAMQKAAASARRSAPEPNGFAKKRIKQDEDFMRSIMQQSQALTDVAKQVGLSIVTSAAPSQAPVAPEDHLLGTIKLALQDEPAD